MSHTETFFKPNIFETDTETFFETDTDTLKKMKKVSIWRSLEMRCHTLNTVSTEMLQSQQN